MKTIEVKVPPIGDFHDVPVIDVLVKPGESVPADAALVTLESEKATMDVPAPAAGTVRELRVKVGDRVSEGSIVVTLEAAEAGGADGKQAPSPSAKGGPASPPAAKPAPARPAPAAPAPAAPAAEAPAAPAAPARAAPRAPVEVKVPSIGDFRDVPIIEVLVKAGETVARDASLVTLESEKATMDVPSPEAGTVREVRVKVGDKVSEGSVVAVVEPAAAPAPAEKPAAPASAPPAAAPAPGAAERAAPSAAPAAARPAPAAPAAEGGEPARAAHAGPLIRRLARELGVDLARVHGSGNKGRVLREDVERFVKDVMTRTASGTAAARGVLDVPPWPKVDFAKFGPIEAKPLARIRKLSAANLSRNWVMIPHVTQFDEADVTDLERFRVELNEEHARDGVKVTLLAFLVKACVAALRQFPELNASLDGDQLVLKRYYHVGFAADTPNGLVVPVIRDADRKGVLELARELGELAAKAREGKLSAAEMQGGCFSISSLGGIGGTAFTPIINAPEVAILGVSRATTRPVWDGAQFAPRLVLPLSLSYDHRVIDGALAARITSFLVKLLGDLRRAML